MRRALYMTLILAALGLPACEEDRQPQCIEVFDHLQTLTRHRVTVDLRRKFISSCATSWDPVRHACLMASTSAEEALECKPKRLRPE